MVFKKGQNLLNFDVDQLLYSRKNAVRHSLNSIYSFMTGIFPPASTSKAADRYTLSEEHHIEP